MLNKQQKDSSKNQRTEEEEKGTCSAQTGPQEVLKCFFLKVK